MLSKLKPTIAVACLLATACFVIPWMRSLEQLDYVIYFGSSIGKLEVGGTDGSLFLSHQHLEDAEAVDSLGFYLLSQTRDSIQAPRGRKSQPAVLLPWPRMNLEPQYGSVAIPFWLLILLFGSLGAAACIRRPLRFSLRTLAIASTAIVVTLGLGVAASRLRLG